MFEEHFLQAAKSILCMITSQDINQIVLSLRTVVIDNCMNSVKWFWLLFLYLLHVYNKILQILLEWGILRNPFDMVKCNIPLWFYQKVSAKYFPDPSPPIPLLCQIPILTVYVCVYIWRSGEDECGTCKLLPLG